MQRERERERGPGVAAAVEPALDTDAMRLTGDLSLDELRARVHLLCDALDRRTTEADGWRGAHLRRMGAG